MAMLETFFPSDLRSSSVIALSDLISTGEVHLQTGPFGTVLAASEYKGAGWPIINPTDMRGLQIVHDGGPCVDDTRLPA